jgi:hypothetical protein
MSGKWHTKNPFRNPNARGKIFDENERCIATVHGVSRGGRNTHSRPEYPFNRELIRSAPELKDLCIALMSALAHEIERNGERDFFEDELYAIRRKLVLTARAAVRKIESRK